MIQKNPFRVCLYCNYHIKGKPEFYEFDKRYFMKNPDSFLELSIGPYCEECAKAICVDCKEEIKVVRKFIPTGFGSDGPYCRDCWTTHKENV